MRPGKIVAAVFGALAALVAIGLIVGGAVLAWAYGTQRDDDGFLTSPTYDLATSQYALVSGDVDLASRPGDWWPSNVGTVRIDVSRTDGGTVFVGIGDSTDVDGYLNGVGIGEITRLGPSSSDVAYESVTGGAPAAPPTDETFWAASTSGEGMQTLEWDIEQGEWTVVVMNADGSPTVAVEAELGARIGVLLAIAIGLLLFGLLVGAGGAALLVWATRREPEEEEAAAAAVPAGRPGRYPVVVEGTLQPGPSRGLWLVKWLLLIPHFIVLAFLWAAFVLLTIAAFFAILFTGRYPRGIFDFNVGVMRWTWRVSFYSYSALGTDQYPPFTLAEVPEYPTRFSVEYPEKLSRGLVLVKWWLLAIPHLIIVGFFTSGLVWWTTDFGGDNVLEFGGGLIGILVLVAGVAILFTGRYPQGLFDLVMGLNRWSFRVGAYVALMRDEYPPFRLDLGGSEGGPEVPSRPLGSGTGGEMPVEPELTRR
jgi:hypothetical protein